MTLRYDLFFVILLLLFIIVPHNIYQLNFIWPAASPGTDGNQYYRARNSHGLTDYSNSVIVLSCGKLKPSRIWRKSALLVE